MAKTAARRPGAKPAPKKSGGGMRPIFLAAGLGLYWFVEYQDIGGASDMPMPMWGYGMTIAVRLLADFVGAWVIVSALHLLLALAKLGFSHLRGLWVQESRG
jgi:hypothetical protein